MDSWELLRDLVSARPDDPRWGVLFRRCRQLIRVVLGSRILGDGHQGAGTLDDLSQDVMERLVSDGRRVIRRFAGTREATFEVYIRRITENILRDQRRHHAYRRSVELSFPADDLWQLEAALAERAIADTSDDPESAVVMRELDECIDGVLRRISLDERQQAQNRRLYQLYFRDHYSIPQIMRLRAVPLSTSSVARRITLIREALQPLFTAERHLARARPAAVPRGASRKRGVSR